MGRIVIAAYRPKRGKREALRRIVLEHVDILRRESLVTDRDPIIMEAEDGTILEVFEWRSSEAIEAAHNNPVVLKMWEEFEAVCEYIPAGLVPELGLPFSEFAPVDR